MSSRDRDDRPLSLCVPPPTSTFLAAVFCPFLRTLSNLSPWIIFLTFQLTIIPLSRIRVHETRSTMRGTRAL